MLKWLVGRLAKWLLNALFPEANQQDASIYLEAVRDKIQLLSSVDDALDTKLSTLFAGGTAVIALVAALFALKPSSLDGHDAVVLGAAIATYVGLTALVGFAIFPKTFPSGSELAELRDDALRSESPNAMRWGNADLLLKNVCSIRKRVDTKARVLKWAFALMFVEVLVFVGATAALL